MRVLRDSVDSYLPSPPLTELELLMSRGVFVDACAGYNCAIPSIVRVDMIMPKLRVATNCSDEGLKSFDGFYDVFSADAHHNFSDVWLVFQREVNLQAFRLLLQRTAPDAFSFRIQLASATGTGSELHSRRHFGGVHRTRPLTQKSSINSTCCTGRRTRRSTRSLPSRNGAMPLK